MEQIRQNGKIYLFEIWSTGSQQVNIICNGFVISPTVELFTKSHVFNTKILLWSHCRCMRLRVYLRYILCVIANKKCFTIHHHSLGNIFSLSSNFGERHSSQCTGKIFHQIFKHIRVIRGRRMEVAKLPQIIFVLGPPGNNPKCESSIVNFVIIQIILSW